MFLQRSPGLSLHEFARAVKSVAPAVLLVPPRILRRIIRGEAPGVIGLVVPHARSYLIDGPALLTYADRDELGLEPSDAVPPVVILLEAPDAEALATVPRPQLMLNYWRRLFHARVHLALRQRRDNGRLTDADVRQRIRCIGIDAFEEIRFVLSQDGYLLARDDDRAVYVEFAAVFLERQFFDARSLPFVFPAVADSKEVAALLEQDTNAKDLFRETRLPHASESGNLPRPTARWVPAEVSQAACTRWLERAATAAATGNVVRAATMRAHVAQGRGCDRPEDLALAAAADLGRLHERLATALEWTPAEAAPWRPVLDALLPLAALGTWPVEARLLYDLQKVCTDFEREIYVVDVVGWVISFGKKPVRRLLPGQQDVLGIKHLRNALSRLPVTRLAGPDRRTAAHLLERAIDGIVTRLRNRFRPVLAAAFDAVGLKPTNYPEQISRDKLIEELLDGVCEHGFLTVGDLRDALSRNQIKLADLSGPREFAQGDPLIKLNRRLAVDLDGVYHPGEIYLRWLQRLSSIGFGTPVGRFVTRYVTLPFGGSFLVLRGLQAMVEEVGRWVGTDEPLRVLNPVSFTLLGIFLLALLHLPEFRHRVVRAIAGTWRAAHWLCYDLPAALLCLPSLRALLASEAFRRGKQWVLKPLACAAPVTACVSLLGAGGALTAGTGIGLYALAAIVLNTRLGRALEETCTDAVIRVWKQIEGDVLPNLFWLVVTFFKTLLNLSEQMLYVVDEWLRFRTGQGRLALVLKAAGGVVWFFVTYLFRIFINLMVEPTINPIKHFPVVTVAAKLLVPFIEPLAKGLTRAFEPMVGGVLGGLIAATLIFFLPGLAGFLVWELKENWRLYRVNRRKELAPALIGHHGETMLRLLRPGFHSGTVPKLYLRLRQAWRKAVTSGQWRTFRKNRDALHLVDHAVRAFIERDLIAMLHGSKSWGGARLHVESVVPSNSRIRISLACPDVGPECCELTFAVQSGWLLARVTRSGWLDALSANQRRALTVALAGQYKHAGLEVVGEQVDVLLGPDAHGWRFVDERLVVAMDDEGVRKADYDLGDAEAFTPDVPGLPALTADALYYSRLSLSWDDWVAAWARDQAGNGLPHPFPKGFRLLPASGLPEPNGSGSQEGYVVADQAGSP